MSQPRRQRKASLRAVIEPLRTFGNGIPRRKEGRGPRQRAHGQTVHTPNGPLYAELIEAAGGSR
jgi:hypothetical protein